MRKYLFEIAVAISCLVLVAGCGNLPDKGAEKAGLEPIRYLDTRLARGFDPLVTEHGSDTGVVLLRDGERALRSTYLNTEVGMFVESTELAEILASQIESHMEPVNSWRPILKNDNVVWVTEEGGQEEIVPYEPHTSWFERVKEGVLPLVPGAKYY